MANPDETNDRPADLAAPLTMKDVANAEELVEVYHAANEFAANAAIEEILAPAGIDAWAHDRRSHALPAPASMPGQIGVAVHRTRAAEARRLLSEAKVDGALIDDEGEVLADPRPPVL